MEQPSTGIDPLDELLGGLGVGDNVVWQATNPADIEPFVHALLATARGYNTRSLPEPPTATGHGPRPLP